MNIEKAKAFWSRNYPKITIVTPSLNQGEFLEECILSIIGQGYPNLEYIIMDGGSSDNSVEIIKKYEKYLVGWKSEPDNGQFSAIEEGFNKYPDGGIMGWLNADDKLHGGSLFKVADIFNHYGNVDWITGRPTVWDSSGRLAHIVDPLPLWSREKYLEGHIGPPHIQQESTFFRRSLWTKAGSFMARQLYLAGDLELWVRFFRYARLYSVDTLIGGFRTHAGQKTDVNEKEDGFDKYQKEALEIIQKERDFHGDIDMFPPLSVVDAPQPISYPITQKKPSVVVKDYRVSAIVTTYCSEIFMANCLENLVNQTIADDVEIIVVDAASPENEGQIVLEYQVDKVPNGVLPVANRLLGVANRPLGVANRPFGGEHGVARQLPSHLGKKYPNIVYIRTSERIGVYAAWNIAVKLATGKYLTTYSTNDALNPRAYEIMANILDENPDVSLVYGDSYVTRIARESFAEHTLFETFEWPEYTYEDLLYNCRVGPHPMWRRSVHERIGFFDETFVAIGDQDFWLRMGEVYKLMHIKEFTGLFWLTSESISQKGQLPYDEIDRAQSKYQKRYVQSLKKKAVYAKKYFKRPLFIWGAGADGLNTLKILERYNIEVDGFIDGSREKWGKTIENKYSIFSPDVVKNNPSSPLIVIATMFANEIRPILEGQGYVERQTYWSSLSQLRWI